MAKQKIEIQEGRNDRGLFYEALLTPDVCLVAQQRQDGSWMGAEYDPHKTDDRGLVRLRQDFGFNADSEGEALVKLGRAIEERGYDWEIAEEAEK